MTHDRFAFGASLHFTSLSFTFGTCDQQLKVLDCKVRMEHLSVSVCDDGIDQVLDGNVDAEWQRDLRMKGYRLGRIKTASGWETLIEFEGDIENKTMSAPIPFFFGLGLYSVSNDKLCGVVTLYMAYSTWDGRCLFIDRLDIPDPKDADMEKAVLRPLASIAIRLQCARLNWKTTIIPTWYEKDPLPPEILRGWLLLKMERTAMAAYTGSDVEVIGSGDPSMLSPAKVHQSVEECLSRINEMSTNFRLRLSTGADVETIVRLVKGLAIYEEEPDAVNITSDSFLCDGYSDEPLFYCLLLEDAKTPAGPNAYCCGMAFFYFGYELGRGRFLYLEDLFIEYAHRKRGGGSLAMKSLARISLALNCENFYWVALDWNTPALNLYEKIGAKVQEGVLISRYTDDKLRSFARKIN